MPPAITATDLPASMSPTGPYRIAMVCTGNICRSAMARVVLIDRLTAAGVPDDGVDGVAVTSSGVSDEEHGNPMDRRARRILADHGYGRGSDDVARAVSRAIAAHRAHRISDAELADSDLILAMTSRHRDALLRRADRLGLGDGPAPGDGPGAEAGRIRLFREFDPAAAEFVAERGAPPPAALDVPDPWYGTMEDFAATLEVVERVSDALAPALVELAAERSQTLMRAQAPGRAARPASR